MSARDHVYMLATEALATLRQTDVSTGADGPEPRPSDPSAAEISRSLLRTADLLELAAHEVRVLYWQHKGMPDPRQGEP